MKKYSKSIFAKLFFSKGRVAQRIRARGYEPRSRGFKSLLAQQKTHFFYAFEDNFLKCSAALEDFEVFFEKNSKQILNFLKSDLERLSKADTFNQRTSLLS